MKKKLFSLLLVLVLVLSFSLVMTAAPVAAADITVNPGESIQAAIDDAAPGDIINVLAGTYQERITIDKQLTLRGADREMTKIEGSGYTASPTLSISASGVTVSGFTVHSESTKEPVWTIWVEGDSTLLTDLHVIKDPDKWISGAAVFVAPGVDSFAFTDSTVDSIWNGIYAPRNPGSSNIVVRNVGFTYPGEYGILLMMTSGATIKGNTFTCTGHSMANKDSNGIIITKGSNAIEVSGNQFIGSQPVLSRNHIGILLQAYAEGTMGDVTILDNGISGFNTGILVQDVATSGISIHYNNISGNAYGVKYLGSGTVDATYNWWGHASGPYHENLNSEGTGDEVSDNVLFIPWLKAPSRPTTPMSSFTIDHAKVDFKKKADDDKVRVQGKLELDLDNGDGVNISEDVIVTVGPLSETITMVEKGKKDERWEYKRPKGGTDDIKHMTINWKNGKFDIRMDKADLTALALAGPEVTISVQIGDYLGEETITMRVKKHHWDYKGK